MINLCAMLLRTLNSSFLSATSAKVARLLFLLFILLSTAANSQETRDLHVEVDPENPKEVFLSLQSSNTDPFAILEIRNDKSELVYYIDPFEVTIAPDYSKIGLYDLPKGRYTIRMYHKNWSATEEFELP